MVVLASPPAAAGVPGKRGNTRRWIAGAAATLAGGIGLRLALGGGGIGDVSAAIMLTLLVSSAWTAAMLVSTPRTAFWFALGLVALANLAALPARNSPEFDAREAFYRTDQTLVAQLPVAAGIAQAQPTLTLLVEPIFPSAQTAPKFELAGEAGGTQRALAWRCGFRRGLQWLALPLPIQVVGGAATLEVRLRLTGTPSRESYYLLVYSSAARGGFVVDLVGAAQSPSAPLCQLA